ncbi:MAG: EAL domain-containing protein [Planctomycetota bacterium]|jgi:lactose/cellobiose-specific phosphotransferase system IIC component|nr:EAL domain-containing protein [Planctomycetota bacterium]
MAEKVNTLDYVPGLFRALMNNTYLKALRNGLTLTLPLVMAGCAAVLLLNFPLQGYQDLMDRVLGARWRELLLLIHNGTLSVMSLVMVVTISHSLAEHHNLVRPVDVVNPVVPSLVSLASLVALFHITPDFTGLQQRWLGVLGMFLAIIVAVASSWLFFALRRIRWLNITFFSEEADSAIPNAFSSLLPGLGTIFLFALIKLIASMLGIDDLHQAFYNGLSTPFLHLGGASYGTAILYNFLRHAFWFLGIHGSNLMEPVSNAIYVPALEANIASVTAGEAPRYIFNKAFFDVFLSMGGSGSTICLIIASLVYSRHGSMREISRLSLLPAAFNINEMLIFGMPIVLNPVFLIPFLLVPLVLCTTSYLAVLYGLVPYTSHHVDWTAPVFISGYTATGSLAGSILQLFNIILCTAIYMPFVALAERMKKDIFNQAFKELMPGFYQGSPGKDYTITQEAKALSRSLTNDLSRALERNELFLEYQPQVDSLTGRVFGVEALMRWNHSHLGRIPPGMFITLAEEAGLIKDMGRWALDEACRQLTEWRKDDVSVIMSVNLSVRQLDDSGLVDDMRVILDRHQLPAELLEVEVTESTALGPESDKTDILQRIHSLGVHLAIDDFGMGHSSLVYLKKFPVDTLKLDRVLTKDVEGSKYSSEIIYTITELANTLKIKPLAEFVDNVSQLKALQAIGCTLIQGYLFSPPLGPADCAGFIKNGAMVY